ncbi:MAG: hypothetical protein NTY02_13750 [Acidobacteria bacterium]|nr:hypothetical protein [Acidobacteriota bacterium]
MFAGKRHLDDSALIRRYLADRGLEALEAADESLLRHLVQCASCEARYIAIQRVFDESRDAAVDAADAAFPADRLAAQRERILRRIDAQYDGPRVIPFPAAAHAAQVLPPSALVRRWVAAAAVAGLIIGLTAGRLIPFSSSTSTDARRQPGAVPASAARPAPVMRSLHEEPVVDEEQLLFDVDLATAAPRAAELRAIYAFTLEESRDIPVRTVKH